MDLPALKSAQRRRYTPEFKQQLVAQCQPNVSVSGVALTNGVNANLLRRWIREHSSGTLPTRASSPARLVPVAVRPEPARDSMIEITLSGKDKKISLSWPVAASSALATLLADLLA